MTLKTELTVLTIKWSRSKATAAYVSLCLDNDTQSNYGSQRQDRVPCPGCTRHSAAEEKGILWPSFILGYLTTATVALRRSTKWSRDVPAHFGSKGPQSSDLCKYKLHSFGEYSQKWEVDLCLLAFKFLPVAGQRLLPRVVLGCTAKSTQNATWRHGGK